MDCLGNPERDDEAMAFIEAVENERLTETYDEIKQYERDRAAASATQPATPDLQTENLFTGRGTKRKHSESSSDESQGD